jgi:protein tyrosine/serine phosphatase
MRLLAAILAATVSTWSAAVDIADPPLRPATWATPLTEPGLPNLNRLTPQLYRAAQPSAAGMRRIEALGVKTVISLRALHDDDDELAGTTLLAERISFKSWHPEDEDVVRFLELATDPERQPVLVHCQHGADRTGMMCAIYRMAVEGWTADDAVREMVDGGYGFHAVWQDLIDYVRAADVARLRKEAGIVK